jgi:hypothetical protein
LFVYFRFCAILFLLFFPPRLTRVAEKTAILKKQFREVKDTIDLVKNAVENMRDLESAIEQYRGKLMDWQGKWETVREQLIEEYRTIKFSFSQREVRGFYLFRFSFISLLYFNVCILVVIAFFFLSIHWDYSPSIHSPDCISAEAR